MLFALLGSFPPFRVGRVMFDDLQLFIASLSVGLTAVLFFLLLIWTYRVRTMPFHLWIVSIVTQDLTDHLVDGETEGSFPLFDYERRLLTPENVHRFRALARKAKDGDFELRGLGREVVGNRHIREAIRSQIGPAAFQAEGYEELLDRIDRDGTIPKGDAREKFERFAMMVYYRAKNWAYGTDSYADELKSIQGRIDFTRSIALVCMTFLVAFALSPLGYALWRLARDFLRPGPSFSVEIPWRRILLASAVILTAAVLSILGYYRSENNFNERTYGYYSSHLHEEARKA